MDWRYLVANAKDSALELRSFKGASAFDEQINVRVSKILLSSISPG